MEKGMIVAQKDQDQMQIETRILHDPQAFAVLSNPLRTKILQLLYHKPMYPIEIAKSLKLHEQKVYYHIKQLQHAGLIDEHERKEIRGTVAKRFKASSTAYSFILADTWKKQSQKQARVDEDLQWFFEPFLGESLQGKIVVGSPDPHGKYKAYARDGHYAIDLSLLLGSLAKLPKDFSVFLDVDVKQDSRQQENMILIGGPVTNTIMDDINDQLPLHFVDNPWCLHSKKTGKKYYNDAVGTIQLIKSPYSQNRFILAIAGIRAIGTKSAILAITRDRSAVRKAFLAKKREFSMVVEGFDVDGDGRIESIEILE